jgi:Tfp pilus assembly protein PilO
MKRDLYEYRRWVRGGLIALVVIDALFFFFSFRPMGRSFSQQNEELKSLRDDAKSKREKVERLRKIEATLGESNRLGEQFYQTKFLPAETGFGTIMVEMERLADSTGVHKGAVSYSVQEIKDRPDIEGVSISTSLQGDYPKIVRFVNQLEQSPLFLIVDSMSASGGRTKNVDVSVTVLTLFRVPKGLHASDSGTLSEAGTSQQIKPKAEVSDAPAEAGRTSAAGKTPAELGKTPAAAGQTPAAAGKRPAEAGKQ